MRRRSMPCACRAVRTGDRVSAAITSKPARFPAYRDEWSTRILCRDIDDISFFNPSLGSKMEILIHPSIKKRLSSHVWTNLSEQGVVAYCMSPKIVCSSLALKLAPHVPNRISRACDGSVQVIAKADVNRPGPPSKEIHANDRAHVEACLVAVVPVSVCSITMIAKALALKASIELALDRRRFRLTRLSQNYNVVA